MTNNVCSMTAYASCQQELNDYGLLTVEVKAVNSKYLDLNIRLPEYISYCEPIIRKAISDKIKRGKIDCTVYIKLNQNYKLDNLYNEQIIDYLNLYNKIRKLSDDLDINNQGLLITDLIKFINTQSFAKQPLYDSYIQEELIRLIATAMEQLLMHRHKEGRVLQDNLLSILDCINSDISKLEQLAPVAQQDLANKFSTKLREVTHSFIQDVHNVHTDIRGKSSGAVDLEIKIAQEIAVYLNKSDVSEELTRLRLHADEVAHILNNGGAIGRKLDFLMQELMRETNTMSAKAVNIDFRNIAINLKVYIEQMREQIQNIE
jgi:uncharacterized protein (TIGR00255 family)